MRPLAAFALAAILPLACDKEEAGKDGEPKSAEQKEDKGVSLAVPDDDVSCVVLQILEVCT